MHGLLRARRYCLGDRSIHLGKDDLLVVLVCIFPCVLDVIRHTRWHSEFCVFLIPLYHFLQGTHFGSFVLSREGVKVSAVESLHYQHAYSQHS